MAKKYKTARIPGVLFLDGDGKVQDTFSFSERRLPFVVREHETAPVLKRLVAKMKELKKAPDESY